MRSSVSVLAFLALALVLSWATPSASEPDGWVRITTVWTPERDGLILRVDPVVPLAEARLVIAVPDVVTIAEIPDELREKIVRAEFRARHSPGWVHLFSRYAVWR